SPQCWWHRTGQAGQVWEGHRCRPGSAPAVRAGRQASKGAVASLWSYRWLRFAVRGGTHQVAYFRSIFLIASAAALRRLSSLSFTAAVSAGSAFFASALISPSAAAVERIPGFLSVSASRRAGTAGLAAAPSCREACVGSLRFLHESC